MTERVFYISPSSSVYQRDSYYLEISWSRFDVRGYMPNCYEDYVEVYLTKSKKSIGRFCSYNAGSPFKMYSHDGVATIEFVSDAKTTGGGFTFYYKLRSKTSSRIGGTPSSTYCYNRYNSYGSNGVIYSSGWPDGYASSYSDCEHSITRSSTYTHTKVVFMDVDMQTSRDYVKLYGSSYYSGYKTSLGKVSSTQYSTKSYKSSYKYLKIEFERYDGSTTSRGFVAGYIHYGKSSSNKSTPSYSGSSFSFTYIIPVIIIVIIAVLLHHFKRRRQLLATRRCTNVAIAVTERHESNVNPPAGATPTSYPQNTVPYPTAYPTSYPESSLSANAPPSYVWSVANKDSPMPVDAEPPPYPVGQPQYPQVPYPPMAAAPVSSNIPPPNAPPGVPPDAPPPSYDSSINK